MQIVIAHARYHVTCTPMQNLGTYLNFPPHITYSLWHFYWAPMKIKGCLLVRPPMLNVKSGENFVRTKIGQILAVLGVWASGVLRSCDFYPKRHMCAWTHIVWAILRQNRSRGVTSRSVREKKAESHRDSHRKDMSPLTQGLNYRSACDTGTEFCGSTILCKIANHKNINGVFTFIFYVQQTHFQ